MHRTHRKKALVSLLLALAITLAGPFGGTQTAKCASVDDLNSKYDQLDDKINDLQDSINDLKSSKSEAQAQKEQLDEQLSLVRQQVAVLEDKIAALNTQIAEKEAFITQKEEEIADNEELFRKRLRAQYMSPRTDGLTAILGSEDFSQMLVKMDTMTRIADHDKQLIEQLEREKQEIVDAKNELAANKADIEASKSLLDAKKAQLASQAEEVGNSISSLEDQQAMNEKQVAQYRSEQKAVQQQIADLLASYENSGDTMGDKYVGGQFQWPVPGYYHISAPYGKSAAYGWEFHTGIDISRGSQASIYGKPIVAANDGKVAVVRYGNTGYGNYVMIDHGGSLYTLYGHTSSIAVRQGQYVKKGQTIAYVGSTGNSSGPHLHFEVRKGISYGSDVNPMPYLQS